MELGGRIAKKVFGTGSKSEREAICLETAGGDYVLRRSGANPFEIDTELEALVGAQVRCSGTLHGYTFLLSDCEVLDKT